jgi:hypothetical protein
MSSNDAKGRRAAIAAAHRVEPQHARSSVAADTGDSAFKSSSRTLPNVGSARIFDLGNVNCRSTRPIHSKSTLQN